MIVILSFPLKVSLKSGTVENLISIHPNGCNFAVKGTLVPMKQL